jgi:tRNA pseudouridine55 synthase
LGRQKKGREINGIFLLDKASGLTSNRALQAVKRVFEAKKAGHTGSLDPLATGVLPLCFGEATKVSQYLLESDKSYRASIKLGQSTDTGDSDGTVIETASDFSIT